MNQLQILSASALLLAAVDAIAQSTDPGAFLIEMQLTERLPPGGVVEVRCVEGCDWTWKTIECPADETECRALIAANSLYDSKESLPPPVRACMGMSMGAGGDPDVSPDARTLLLGVIHGSPADQAGMEKGDVLVSFNRVPVQEGPRPVWETVHSMIPGQAFEATVERDGALIDVRGHVGMRTSEKPCAPLDASQLQNATTDRFEIANFEIGVKLSTSHAVFRCLKGCYWTEFPFTRRTSYETCEIRLGQERNGMSCQGLGPRPE